MIYSRSWLPAIVALVPAIALVQPAQAAVDAAVAARPAHQGLAFAAHKDAKARIVEPDGRVLIIDGRPDLVAPASIASNEAKNAIAKLIQIAAPARSAPATPARRPPGRT